MERKDLMPLAKDTNELLIGEAEDRQTEATAPNLTCERFEPLEVFEFVQRQVTRKPLYYAHGPFREAEIAAHLASGDCALCSRWSRNAKRTCLRLSAEGKLPASTGRTTGTSLAPEAEVRECPLTWISMVGDVETVEHVYTAGPFVAEDSPFAGIPIHLTCRETTASPTGWELYLSFHPGAEDVAKARLYDGTLMLFRLTDTRGNSVEFETRLDLVDDHLISSPCPLKGLRREELASFRLVSQQIIGTEG